jgi:small-conductance mechanosensitive channel/CRP-like cAMP-binding protein
MPETVILASMFSNAPAGSAVTFLGTAFLIYILLVALGRRLKRQQGVQLGWTYYIFSLAFAIWAPAWLLDLEIQFLREIGVAAIITSAFFLNALVKRYVWEVRFSQQREAPVPKLLSDTTAIVIVIIAVILVVYTVYGVEIPGLLTGSGILAIILGFALQDLLGNIIGGFAIHFGQPFKAGDWLQVGDRRAQVVEINWRSTRMRTADDVLLDIPNRELVRQTIVNYHYPTPLHSLRVNLGVDQAAPPTRVKDVLIHAAANAKGVLPEPRIRAFTKHFGEHYVEYELQFWINDNGIFNDVMDAVRTNIWYGFHRHGIKLSVPIRTVRREKPAAAREHEMQTTARNILRREPLFQCLSDVELDELLPRGRLEHFGRGEKIIEQGEEGTSMFILVDGEATVTVDHGNETTRVGGLHAGECFGEMSLLTGQKRSATVMANTDCEVVEIGKAVLANSLKQKPELLHKLSDLLAKRQLETEGILSTAPKTTLDARHNEYRATFRDRLRAFFEL